MRLISVSVLVLLCACHAPRDHVEITFSAHYQGNAVSCGDTPFGLSDLRFFVSELALVDAKGGVQPVPLLQDDRWQSRDIALIDLENGQGGCSNGTAAMNATLRGTVEPGQYVGLQFTLGVPFQLNHANPLLATPPLDDAAMHWHWRSGYKFLRAGVWSLDDGYWLHLGSTGCTGTVQDIRSCESPNRVLVELTGYVMGQSHVVIDMSALVNDVDLADAARSDCSSGPAEVPCVSAFEALGLRFSNSDAGNKQRVFRVAQ